MTNTFFDGGIVPSRLVFQTGDPFEDALKEAQERAAARDTDEEEPEPPPQFVDERRDEESLQFRPGASFSSDSPESYRQAIEIIRQPWLEPWGLGVEDIRHRINFLAKEMVRTLDLRDAQGNQRWPSSTELVAWEPFAFGINNFALGYASLPPMFYQDGFLIINDPIFGPQFDPRQLTQARIDPESGEVIEPEQPITEDQIVAAPFRGADVGPVLNMDFLTQRIAGSPTLIGGEMVQRTFIGTEPFEQQRILEQEAFAPGATGASIRETLLLDVIPSWSSTQVDEQLQSIRMARVRRPGGGGSRRAPLVLDLRALRQRAEELYRRNLVEEPEGVEGIVQDYEKEAKAFWRRGGATLDFDSFVLERLEQTGRWNTLYRKKPEHLSPQQYLSRFTNIAESAGLSDVATQRAITTGAASGASATGFQERLRGTREFQIRNTGSMGQRFAGQFAQLGALGRS